MVKYSRVDTVGEERSERKRIMKERKEFGARMGLASQCNAHKEVYMLFRGMVILLCLIVCKKNFCKKK